MLLNEYHAKVMDIGPPSYLETDALLSLADPSLPSVKAKLGEILWMLTALCDIHGCTLRAAAQANLDHLAENLT